MVASPLSLGCPGSFATMARNKLSALLNESSMMMSLATRRLGNAAEMVWIGAAPPSPSHRTAVAVGDGVDVA